jgi:Pseudouridylate synthase
VRRVALKIAYLGTDYYGFQRQPDLTTVEGEILSALEETGVVADVNRCGFSVAVEPTGVFTPWENVDNLPD